MHIVKTAIKYSNFLFNAPASTADKEHIFIFSHKRARTTLLSHLLGSHDDICGYRELHCSYLNKLDLLKSRAALFQDKQSFINAKYLLDKVLHNEWEFEESLFENKPIKYIFVLRKPERSMLSMVRRHLTNNDISTISIQYDYYLSRLIQLGKYWQSLKGQKLYIDSDQLIQNSGQSLPQLSDFLGLSYLLNEHYNIFSDTGKAGMGDMSENISSGKIISNEKPLTEEEKQLLSSVNMDKLNHEYEKLIITFQNKPG